jgi:sulfur relay (sulfurtransferase) complex TusBCD TusD component (DsrE family)
MAKYLLVEARDPFDSADVSRFYDLAVGMAEQAEDVTVFLVQNGVLPTRRNSVAAAQVKKLATKTTVLADEFSLRERGISTDDLADGVEVSTIDGLVDLLAEDGRKVLWH